MATKRRKVDAKCKGFNGAENIQMEFYEMQ